MKRRNKCCTLKKSWSFLVRLKGKMEGFIHEFMQECRNLEMSAMKSRKTM